jgi:hypothetical protein
MVIIVTNLSKKMLNQAGVPGSDKTAIATSTTIMAQATSHWNAGDDRPARNRGSGHASGSGGADTAPTPTKVWPSISAAARSASISR